MQQLYNTALNVSRFTKHPIRHKQLLIQEIPKVIPSIDVRQDENLSEKVTATYITLGL